MKEEWFLGAYFQGVTPPLILGLSDATQALFIEGQR